VPSSLNWTDGLGGATPVSAANLGKLMVTADAATAGTPTGDALRAAFEAKVSRTSATTGQVPTLQSDGTLAFASVSGGGLTLDTDGMPLLMVPTP
jgi:hypothetical protein